MLFWLVLIKRYSLAFGFSLISPFYWGLSRRSTFLLSQAKNQAGSEEDGQELSVCECRRKFTLMGLKPEVKGGGGGTQNNSESLK